MDDTAAPRKRKPERQGAKSEKLVGKRIAVKWASKGGKNFIMTAGKSGPSDFYSGKVMAYKPVRNRYEVIETNDDDAEADVLDAEVTRVDEDHELLPDVHLAG